MHSSRPPATPHDWYVRYGPVVMRRALQILGSEVEALEVLQDVFMSLLENPGQYGGRSSPCTWLYAATTNRCLNVIRNRTRRATLLANESTFSLQAAAPCPPEAFLALRETLAGLPESVAQAGVYFHLDGMSYLEIAEVMNCSRRKVASLLAQLPYHEPQREEAQG